MKFMIAHAAVLSCMGVCLGQPAAVATNAEESYCFARVRGLDPGRQPTSYISLQLRVRVVYRNAGTRPLILPLESERTSTPGSSLKG